MRYAPPVLDFYGVHQCAITSIWFLAMFCLLLKYLSSKKKFFQIAFWVMSPIRLKNPKPDILTCLF